LAWNPEYIYSVTISNLSTPCQIQGVQVEKLLNEKLTTAEMAGELKRSPETLIRWRRLRVGPPFIRMQGRVLYDRAAVQKWLQDHSVQAGAE
jgi:hypothetical protein